MARSAVEECNTSRRHLCVGLFDCDYLSSKMFQISSLATNVAGDQCTMVVLQGIMYTTWKSNCEISPQRQVQYTHKVNKLCSLVEFQQKRTTTKRSANY